MMYVFRSIEMDKEKKESLKRKKIEDTSDGQKKEDVMERGGNRLQEENHRLRKMKMAASTSVNKETKEDGTDELFEETLEGTETEYSTDETVVSTSEEFDVLCNYDETVLSPKGSSTKNSKGIKKQKTAVEQAAENNNQEEETVVFPKELSMNNPTGMKNKQVSEDEDEEEKEKEKKLISDSLSDDTLSDGCTGKLPTSLIDKFMDSDKDEAMRSPPGDQGL